MITWQILAFLLCVALATATQGITGFALVLVLLGLTGVFDLASLPDAANVATVLGLANAAVALRGRRHTLDRTVLQPTAIGTLAGVAMGVALLAWLNANVVVLLRLLLGVLVIASAVLVLRKAEPLPQRSSTGSFYVAGLLSGVLGGLFSAGGPPLVWQFYRQPMTLQAVRDTMVTLFGISGLLRLAIVLPSGQFTPHALLLTVLAVPVVMAVTWWLKHHPPAWDREAVLKIVCALLALTGVGLIVPALHALC